MKQEEDTKDVIKNKWRWAWIEDKRWLKISIHQCIAIYWMPLGPPPPPAARSASPATSLEGRRVMLHGNTVRAAGVGSQSLMHRFFGDCKLPAQPISPWPLHRAPVGSTLLRGERGVQCKCFTPSCLAGGWRDRGYVFVCQQRQKCITQSQKQWYFLSLTMVALFYKWTHPVPLFTFQFRLELPRGKFYNLRLLFWI